MSESKAGLTYNAMKAESAINPDIAARIRLLDFRETEEFYDLKNDPDALVNLIDNPQYKMQIEQFREAMEQKMRQTDDHILSVFRHRTNPDSLKSYVQAMQQRANDQKLLSNPPGR
jgi:N-sulfoglucosamine sulfohydrolase